MDTLAPPVTCVWEITMGCNMRCRHCGSICADPLPDELTTGEATNVIGQMAALGMKWVTLSGGEPLTRADWPVLVRELARRGVGVNMITNGWLLTPETAALLRDSGIGTLAISVDGTPDVHDRIRRQGSFERLRQAFANLRAVGVDCGAVTTVTRENIDILPQLKDELLGMGVGSWQLQIGLPMGSLAERPGWLLVPEQIDVLIDFCHGASVEGRIRIYPADCIGYYTSRDVEIKRRSFGAATAWDGCNAGMRGFGLLHNGEVLGCTSIRDRAYIEGSVRERSLADMWYAPGAFAWRRGMRKTDLGKDCAICIYGERCLGGCPNTRLTMHKTIHGENDYCAHNVAIKKARALAEARTDADGLWREARKEAGEGLFQSAAVKLERMLALDPAHVEGWRLKGFVEYANGNFGLSEAANRTVLEHVPDDPYARKGLGLSLHRQDRTDQGIRILEDLVRESGGADEDAVHDLFVVYRETGRHEDARRLRGRLAVGVRDAR